MANLSSLQCSAEKMENNHGPQHRTPYTSRLKKKWKVVRKQNSTGYLAVRGYEIEQITMKIHHFHESAWQEKDILFHKRSLFYKCECETSFLNSIAQFPTDIFYYMYPKSINILFHIFCGALFLFVVLSSIRNKIY